MSNPGFPPGLSEFNGTQVASLLALITAVQGASPTAGQTVNVRATNQDILLWLSPAGTIASATITLPADNVTRIDQRISFGTSQTITALTINGATTIYNAPTTLQAGDLYTMRKVAANTWALQQ